MHGREVLILVRKGFMQLGLPKSKQVLTDESPLRTLGSMGNMDSWIELGLRKRYVDVRPAWGEPRPLEKGWTPSGLGEPNDRLLIAGVLGFRGDPISERLQRIFHAGNDIEDRWIQRFKEIGAYISSGDWVPENKEGEIVLRGKIDIIVEHLFEPGRQFIVEVKSISPTGYKSLPRPSHNAAVNFENLYNVKGEVGQRVKKYMHQLQAYLSRMDFEEGILLFDNKGTQEFSDFLIKRDEQFIGEVFERLARLQEEYWAKDLLPPWNGGNRGKSIMATYKPTEAIPVEEVRMLYDHEGQF